MRKLMAEINVVPYIDVMLVLLIIFMVTVPLIQQGVEVDLPKAKTRMMDTSEIPDPLIVTIDGKGRPYLNKGPRANHPLTKDAMTAQIDQLLSTKPGEVYVRGDRNARYEDVIGVMVVLQNAGADSIGLITQPLERER